MSHRVTVYLAGARALGPPIEGAYPPGEFPTAWRTAIGLRHEHGDEFLAASFLVGSPAGTQRWWVTHDNDLDGGQPYPPR